jgi:hypothetical protein
MRLLVLYFHRNSQTNEVFYVGIGSVKRANDLIRRNRFWKIYVKKHGKPIVDIIRVDLTLAEANNAERFYISLLGRRIADESGVLVNITEGGDGTAGLKGTLSPRFGCKVSDETKAKLSKAFKGRKMPASHGLKIAAAQTGRKLSESWRKSLSESKRGEKNPFYKKAFTAEHKAKLGGRTGAKHPRYGKKNTEESKTKRRLAIGDSYKRSRHPYAKHAICEITGIAFGCLKDAWDDSGHKITYQSFVRCLRGEKTNYTGYKLLINAKS